MNLKLAEKVMITSPNWLVANRGDPTSESATRTGTPRQPQPGGRIEGFRIDVGQPRQIGGAFEIKGLNNYTDEFQILLL